MFTPILIDEIHTSLSLDTSQMFFLPRLVTGTECVIHFGRKERI